ncbi:hypothetical protein P692DRAFT_20822120 [Suillus brevipes Sb2]|nr:hypothetical protein P692DRAFT_20822120 [Suillus brevipes Sb2]
MSINHTKKKRLVKLTYRHLACVKNRKFATGSLRKKGISTTCTSVLTVPSSSASWLGVLDTSSQISQHHDCGGSSHDTLGGNINYRLHKYPSHDLKLTKLATISHHPEQEIAWVYGMRATSTLSCIRKPARLGAAQASFKFPIRGYIGDLFQVGYRVSLSISGEGHQLQKQKRGTGVPSDPWGEKGRDGPVGQGIFDVGNPNTCRNYQGAHVDRGTVQSKK